LKLIFRQFQDDLYGDPVTLFSLFLAVDIPESSRISPALLSSPLAALATFECHSLVANKPPPTDLVLPAWTQMVPKWPLLFRQPRGAMAEVFASLAFWRDNYISVRFSSPRIPIPFLLTMPRGLCRKI
jgi:hypothetical protein